ncbi:50S ribosomal protein L3 [Methanococcoides sp. SA1]|nr:50S ribosomal protein L3 [Methanococcoides sp. SA1]
MTDNNGIRSGSLQFYPRVRAKKVVPRVNWRPVSKDGVGLMGFVGYKVGMISVWAKDLTDNSMTKDKRVAIPATLIECPAMKIYNVRFYKGNKVLKDFLVDKKFKAEDLDKVEDFDDVRVLMASGVAKTGIGKKKSDLVEVGISGDKDEKLGFVKENLAKEISVGEVFEDGLVDVRGVTKGYGTCGPVKRFGIALKDHKSEKGQRRPGSLAPWHPARVTFRAPQAGQTGYHKRICYNNVILKSGKIAEDDVNVKGGFNRYGNVKNDYLVLKGSVPGPKKRGLVITPAIRPTKFMAKKKFEVLELR